MKSMIWFSECNIAATNKPIPITISEIGFAAITGIQYTHHFFNPADEIACALFSAFLFCAPTMFPLFKILAIHSHHSRFLEWYTIFLHWLLKHTWFRTHQSHGITSNSLGRMHNTIYQHQHCCIFLFFCIRCDAFQLPLNLHSPILSCLIQEASLAVI